MDAFAVEFGVGVAFAVEFGVVLAFAVVLAFGVAKCDRLFEGL